MNQREQEAVLAISLMAAFADGQKDDREREQIKRITEALAADSGINVPALYQDVLLNRRTLGEEASALASPEFCQLAFEMAVCVCDADGARTAAEQSFLDQLRSVLNMDQTKAREIERQADALATVPPASGQADRSIPASVDAAALDKSILNYSILNGALELLPESLGTMAILPLQMKMVYSIGKAYGYELDTGHIKDFAATLGVGLTGQYIEQVGRKLIGGLLKGVGGSILGGLGKTVVSTGLSFATTYALGMVAKQYYAGGRTISFEQLKQVFASLLEQGKSLQSRYTAEIRERARTLDTTRIVELVRQQ